MEASDPRSEPPPASQAEAIAQEVRHRWERHGGDPDRLVEQVMAALSAEAGHELRQVLAQLATHTELLLMDPTSPSAGDRLERIRSAIDRAAQLVETHLDAAEAAKLAIRIDPVPLDLGELLGELPTRLGPILKARPLEVDLESAWVAVDRRKLMEVVTALALRFLERSEPDAPALLWLRREEGSAHGFLGLHEGLADERALVAAIARPLDLGSPSLDATFARALVERHGGSFQVERREGRIGYGFYLPLSAATTVDPDTDQRTQGDPHHLK